MKTIITLTDAPDGGVNVDYLTQMTTAEIDRGMRLEESPGYRVACQLNRHLESAQALASQMRPYHTAREKSEAETARTQGQKPCLH